MVSNSHSPVEVFAPALAGPAAVIYGDDQRTAQALRAVHAADAARYATYRASLGAVCRMLRSLLTTPAPGVDEPDVRDLWNLLQAGRHFGHSVPVTRRAASMGADASRRFRGQWFESDLLRATVASPGLSGTMFGPRSAGSALVVLLREATKMLPMDPREQGPRFDDGDGWRRRVRRVQRLKRRSGRAGRRRRRPRSCRRRRGPKFRHERLCRPSIQKRRFWTWLIQPIFRLTSY